MNVYEVDIWRSVYHSGEFSHNATRIILVHALNEERAIRKIELDKGKTMGQEPHIIKASDETIYSIKRTGTVTKQVYYEYSDGRNPIRVKRN